VSEHLHLLVEAALFRQIADAVEQVARKRLVEEAHGAGVRHGHADHHADGAGLTGAVGAEQSKHCAGLDGQGKTFDRDLRVVDLANVVEFDDGHPGLV
jgi:hypothetical protein